MSQAAKMSDDNQLSASQFNLRSKLTSTAWSTVRPINLSSLTNVSDYWSYLTQAKFWPVSDVKFMQMALQLAQQGASKEEVPVGAVLVHDGRIIGEGYNQPILSCDPTAHAEVVALRSACHNIENYR